MAQVCFIQCWDSQHCIKQTNAALYLCVYDNLIIAFNFVFHHNKLDWLILFIQAFGIDSHSKTPYVLKAANSGASKSSKVGP